MFTVETKYSLGNKVWFISKNKVVGKIVTQVNVKVKPSVTDACDIIISYMLDYSSDKINEDLLFSSKEELLKSL